MLPPPPPVVSPSPALPRQKADIDMERLEQAYGPGWWWPVVQRVHDVAHVSLPYLQMALDLSSPAKVPPNLPLPYP